MAVDWSLCDAVERVSGKVSGSFATRHPGFDGFRETHLADQQNLEGRKLAIVELSRHRWKPMEASIDRTGTALNNAIPGSYTIVDI